MNKDMKQLQRFNIITMIMNGLLVIMCLIVMVFALKYAITFTFTDFSLSSAATDPNNPGAGYILLFELFGGGLMVLSMVFLWGLVIILLILSIMKVLETYLGYIWYKKFLSGMSYGRNYKYTQSILNGIFLVGTLFLLINDFKLMMLMAMVYFFIIEGLHLYSIKMIDEMSV